MKERQLERAEIAKAALQTDEAESQLVLIKREYLSYKGQSQEELKKAQEALQESEKQVKKLYYCSDGDVLLYYLFFDTKN